MKHVDEIAVLRTRLRAREHGIQRLVRTKGGDDRFLKMDELRARRQALMALIAKAAGISRCTPSAKLRPDAVVRRHSRAQSAR